MASDIALKSISAGLMLVFGMVGGLSPTFCEHVAPKWVASLADAFSSGVLLSVGTCHMLGDGSSGVDEQWGKAITQTFKPKCAADPDDDDCDSFPAGLMLFLVGIFLMFYVHAIGSHKHDHHARQVSRNTGELAVGLNGSRTPFTPTSTAETADSTTTGGCGTLMAVSTHSIIEGVAVGAATSSALGFFVLLHKYFAAFAVGASLLPQRRALLKYMGIVFFGLTGPVSAVAGMIAAKDLDGVWSEALSCTAGGTLVAVAFMDMLLPSLDRSPDLKWLLLLSASIGAAAMTFIAIWT
mmetsp:Transcript_25721/g.46996  ORF Transcript_25721/g.46996 Transcript_25721/m.46996 type:complete len:296 (-) Transcript_25721:131-1018(-)